MVNTNGQSALKCVPKRFDCTIESAQSVFPYHPAGSATHSGRVFAMDLKQLSNLLGLSPTTVSRALNGYSEVSPTTRERVAEAAALHGYRANPAARRLALGKADAVGFVYPPDAVELSDTGALGVMSALSEAFSAKGIDLMIVLTCHANELATYRRLMQSRRVDALIVARTLVNDPRVDFLLERRFPFVTFGRTARSAEHPWFDFDNAAGPVLAVERLVSLGHRAIGYMHAPLEMNFALQRWQGFHAGLARAGLAPRSAWIVPSRFSQGRRGGYQAMQQVLALPERPTAMVVDNSLACIGALRAVLDAGLTPGREISIIAQDYVPDTDLLVAPSITSIEHADAQRVGAQLAELVMGVQAGYAVEAMQLLWPPSLRLGATDGPPS